MCLDTDKSAPVGWQLKFFCGQPSELYIIPGAAFEPCGCDMFLYSSHVIHLALGGQLQMETQLSDGVFIIGIDLVLHRQLIQLNEIFSLPHGTKRQ